MSAATNKSAEEQAIELIAPRKYHQCFKVPATASHGPLRVTYGIAGIIDGEDVPTILFCGGMFGSRWQAVVQNHIAEQEGVRILFIDRPGFGGTTPVPLSQRLPTFLEVVPALLSHLKIKHVHLASQSAGTLFCLNLLALNPSLLSPNQPTITLFSPWVHQSHTGMSLLNAASKLPDFMLNHWASLTGFMINNLLPSVATSTGAITSISSWLGSSTGLIAGPNASKDSSKEAVKAWEEERCIEVFGTPVKVKTEVDKLIMRYAFTEECSGGNDEARLCLKSLSDVSWGALESYPTYITSLSEAWEKRVNESKPKLTVRLLLAEEDAMIGEKGTKYLQDMWTKEKCGKGVDVDVITLDGTNHDSVLDPMRGAMSEYYQAVREGKKAFADAEAQEETSDQQLDQQTSDSGFANS